MQYELIYIIDTALEEEARNQLIARFSGLIEQNGGTIDSVEEWGKRRLAYPILKLNEGIYVVINMTTTSDVALELNRQLTLNEQVLRTKLLRTDGK